MENKIEKNKTNWRSNMKMRIPYLILTTVFIIAGLSNLNAQTLQRWVIGSGGSVALSNSNNDTLYSQTGQTAIFTLSTAENTLHNGFWVPYDPPTGVEDDATISLTKKLGNFPNPFNINTTIKYILPANGFVSIKIYDMVGHVQKTLVNTVQASGEQIVTWDGKDENGVDCSSGSYMYELNLQPVSGFSSGSSNDFNLRNVMVIVR